jgi:hypothetical protein
VKVLQLVDWMDKLSLRVCHQDITLNEINNENKTYNKFLISKETLIVEIKQFDCNEPWIIGLELETGKIVLVPWWYVRELKL